jgi:hypothetical protein
MCPQPALWPDGAVDRTISGPGQEGVWAACASVRIP